MSSDEAQQIAYLEGMNPLREATLRAAVGSFGVPRGSRGLDIGCGIGDVTVLLAEAVGPEGAVTGLDISGRLLQYAARRVAGSAASGQVHFAQGDMLNLPVAPGVLDWAWSVDCVGYPAGDLLPMLRQIRRLLRPEGRVVLLGWTDQQVLPGHEALEARLNAQCSAFAPFLEGHPPQAHFRNALPRFREAGLVDTTCQTVVGRISSPLSAAQRQGMALLFEMLWGGSLLRASRANQEAYRRLCLPTSPDFIGDVPGYSAAFMVMVFSGTVRFASSG
jgi:demethylmenaquinone methyltransferase/2-methoxy-6-polyprenyl-1,4-benzoquinol methylase